MFQVKEKIQCALCPKKAGKYLWGNYEIGFRGVCKQCYEQSQPDYITLKTNR